MGSSKYLFLEEGPEPKKTAQPGGKSFLLLGFSDGEKDFCKKRNLLSLQKLYQGDAFLGKNGSWRKGGGQARSLFSLARRGSLSRSWRSEKGGKKGVL